jgi:hypothetical protein
MANAESGSGGSGTGVITTFEDGDWDGGYRKRLEEVGEKVDSIDAFIDETAKLVKSPNPATIDWLGKHSLRPQLDLPRLEEVTNPYMPVPESSSIHNHVEHN